MIIRVKKGEETNQTAKLRIMFLSRDTMILGKIGTNQVLKIKQTKKKKVEAIITIKIRRTFTQQLIVLWSTK